MSMFVDTIFVPSYEIKLWLRLKFFFSGLSKLVNGLDVEDFQHRVCM